MNEENDNDEDTSKISPPPLISPPTLPPPSSSLSSSQPKCHDEEENLKKMDSVGNLLQRTQLLDNHLKYGTNVPKPFHLFVGTWNVNAKPPSKSDGLITWILGGDRRTRRSASRSRSARSLSTPDNVEIDTNQYMNMLPDIYVIGLQELVKLDSKAAMSDKEGLHREAEWQAWLLRVINSSALVNKKAVQKKETSGKPRRLTHGKNTSFRLLGKKMLMGLLVLVFVKNSVDVEFMASAHTAAGILGVVGNKGAVGVALKHHGHRMAFVCAHLAAGRGKTKERNQNV